MMSLVHVLMMGLCFWLILMGGLALHQIASTIRRHRRFIGQLRRAGLL